MAYSKIPATGTHRFQIQEHLTSLSKTFCITDENEHCLYTVKSSFFALGGQFTLFDSDGTERFEIRQQLKHIHLTFNIYNSTSKLATVKQIGFPLKHTLEIQSIYGNYLLKRDGGLMCYEYTLSKDGHIVAEIKQKVPAFAERYTVDIDEHVDDGDIPFILTLVITLWCAQRGRGEEIDR